MPSLNSWVQYRVMKYLPVKLAPPIQLPPIEHSLQLSPRPLYSDPEMLTSATILLVVVTLLLFLATWKLARSTSKTTKDIKTYIDKEIPNMAAQLALMGQQHSALEVTAN